MAGTQFRVKSTVRTAGDAGGGALVTESTFTFEPASFTLAPPRRRQGVGRHTMAARALLRPARGST